MLFHVFQKLHVLLFRVIAIGGLLVEKVELEKFLLDLSRLRVIEVTLIRVQLISLCLQIALAWNAEHAANEVDS